MIWDARAAALKQKARRGALRADLDPWLDRVAIASLLPSSMKW